MCASGRKDRKTSSCDRWTSCASTNAFMLAMVASTFLCVSSTPCKQSARGGPEEGRAWRRRVVGGGWWAESGHGWAQVGGSRAVVGNACRWGRQEWRRPRHCLRFLPSWLALTMQTCCHQCPHKPANSPHNTRWAASTAVVAPRQWDAKDEHTLGSPVVPLVYMMVHRSSGLGGAAQGAGRGGVSESASLACLAEEERAAAMPRKVAGSAQCSVRPPSSAASSRGHNHTAVHQANAMDALL